MRIETSLPWLSNATAARVEKEVVTEAIRAWAVAAVVWEAAPRDDEFDGTAANCPGVSRSAVPLVHGASHGLHIWRGDHGEVYVWHLSTCSQDCEIHIRRTPGRVSPKWLSAAFRYQDGRDDSTIYGPTGVTLRLRREDRYVLSARMSFGRWHVADIPDLRRDIGFGLGLTLGHLPNQRKTRADVVAYRRMLLERVAEGERDRERLHNWRVARDAEQAAMTPEDRAADRERRKARIRELLQERGITNPKDPTP